MSKFGFHNLLAALFCSGDILPALAADDSAKNIPDFMAGGMGWNSAGQLTAVPGSPSPVVQDPKVKYVPNNVGGQPTWRVADVNNPNLTQCAKEGLKKANDMVAEGFAMYNRTSRCWQPGAAVLSTSPGRTYFLQTPKEVYIIWQRDQIVRHVYLECRIARIRNRPGMENRSAITRATRLWSIRSHRPPAASLIFTARPTARNCIS